MPAPNSPVLAKFRGICRELLAAGITPTATRLVDYGYAYPRSNYGGATLKSGRYAIARREEYAAAGYVPVYRRDGQVARYSRAN